MFIPVLSFLHNLTTMLFGIFISAFFLGVKQNTKNVLSLFLFFCLEGILYITTFLLFGATITDRLYAVIVHLPLILFLNLYYKYPATSAWISVSSAYLCCQLSNWIGLLALAVTNATWCYYIARITTTILTFILLCKFVCHTTKTIFAKDIRELCIIGFLPSVYYISDYAFTKLSSLLYSGNKLVVEFMGFSFCITYLIFLFIYFREHEKKIENKRYSDLMELQLSSIQKETEQLKTSKQKLAILRHDSRHHLNIILTQLQNNKTEAAIDYIHDIIDAYDDTIITKYCQNETVNSVISIYQTHFADRGITLNCNISTGESIPCPDTAICMILSNALENSMHSLEEMDIGEKWTNLSISVKENHLLLQITNPVLHIPKFVDGIPTSGKKGHGIGVKSIVYYVESLNGQYLFSVEDHLFILKIII